MKKRIPKSFTLLLFLFLLSNYLSATPGYPIISGTTVSAINVTAAAANGGILTCANSSLGLSATATGSGTTTWRWSGPGGFTSSLQNPSVTAGGTYTVVATNSSGTGSASVTVTENKMPPDITATGGTQACSTTITLTANSTVSGVTYSWTGPNGFTSNEQNPDVIEAGTYTVLVTNPATGCSNQQSVSVIAGAAVPATLWLENFNGLSNGATSDAGATAWTAVTSGAGTYSVQNNEFKTSFSGQGEGVWTSQEINISGKWGVFFSVDLRSEATPNNSFKTSDYIRIYYKVDGGEEQLVFEDDAGIGSSTTGTASYTFNSWVPNSSTLQLIIKTNNSDDNERYYFDNIEVTGSAFVRGEDVTATGGVITCALSSVTLRGNAAQSVNYYHWTGPDNFNSTEQNPVVTAPGIYTLEVFNQGTGCSGTGTAEVVANNSAPGACASASGTLSCTGTSSVTLSGSSSTSGVTYNWAGPNNFTAAAQNPVVTAIGPYNLTVTNPATGCTSTATVNVTTSISSTGSIWLEDFTLANGVTSDAGATAWTTSKNPSTAVISVLNNELRVTNCTNTGEVVWASGSIDISGKTNIVVSAGTRSSVNNNALMNDKDYLRFYYKLNNGAEVLFAEKKGIINGHSTTPTPVSVTIPDDNYSTLQVIIKSRATANNKFYYVDNIQVAGTSHTPLIAEATATDILTCTRNSVGLTGSISATSPVNYSWTGPDNFTSTTQNPSATAAGVYTLTITDCATGCTASDTALVSLNNTPPYACVSAVGTLNCNSGSSAPLNGSSPTPEVTFNWTGPNNFTSNEQNPVVTVAGNYNLTVTNPVNGCTSTASATVTNDNSVTTTWVEDFTLPDGTISDAGATPWTTSKTVSAAEIEVHDNHLRITNCTTTGEVVWRSGAIDVTGKSYVFIRAGVRSSVINGAVMTTDPVNGDYIRIYYKLDNGNEVLFGERTGDIAWHSETPSIVPTGLSPSGNSTLQLIVRARATGNDEFYYVDNMQVVAAGYANISASATGGAINCINNSVALQGSAAESGVSYAWSGPDGYTSSAQNPVVTKVGTYTLTVALGACTDTAATTVIMDTTKPDLTASAIPIQLTCTATPATLTGNSSIQNGSWTWSKGGSVVANTRIASVTQPGTYTCKVVNPANGCSSPDKSVVVTQNITPPPAITVSHVGKVTCLTPAATITGNGSAQGLTYRWSGPNGFTANTLTTAVARGGTYTLTATDPVNGCTTSASTAVEENTAQPGEISIFNSGTITCLNSSVTISGQSSSSGVNYKWEGPNGYTSSSSSATVTRGGIYTLKAINPVNGCESGKSTNVAEFTTAPTFTIVNTSPISCANPTVTLSATTTTPNAEFLWIGPDFVSVDATTTTSTSGFYFITVKNPVNGCNTTQSIEVTENYSDCGARKSTTVAATKPADQNIPAAQVTSFTYKAYPNPVITNGVIEFTSPQSTNTTVSLYNALGTCEKVLFKSLITANRIYRVAIPAAQLQAGAYYFIINTGSKSYTGKLVIMK